MFKYGEKARVSDEYIMRALWITSNEGKRWTSQFLNWVVCALQRSSPSCRVHDHENGQSTSLLSRTGVTYNPSQSYHNPVGIREISRKFKFPHRCGLHKWIPISEGVSIMSVSSDSSRTVHLSILYPCVHSSELILATGNGHRSSVYSLVSIYFSKYIIVTHHLSSLVGRYKRLILACVRYDVDNDEGDNFFIFSLLGRSVPLRPRLSHGRDMPPKFWYDSSVTSGLVSFGSGRTVTGEFE